MSTANAFEVFLIGVMTGAVIWVPVGRMSQLLLLKGAWRAEERRQLVRRRAEVTRAAAQQQAQHAGQYVGARASWTQLDPPGRMARVRD